MAKHETEELTLSEIINYRISWPEHVTFPRFNNDAFYTRISEV
jgi:hypothetical protein